MVSTRIRLDMSLYSRVTGHISFADCKVRLMVSYSMEGKDGNFGQLKLQRTDRRIDVFWSVIEMQRLEISTFAG